MSDLIWPVSGFTVQDWHRQKEPSNGPKDNERIRAQPSCSVTPALKVGSATRNRLQDSEYNKLLPLGIFSAGLFNAFIYYLDDEQYGCKIW